MGNQQNPLKTVQFLYAQNSFLGFYRGFSVLLMREIPFSMIQMPIYERVKKALKKDKEFLSFYEGAFAGVIGGGTAALLTNPIDVVKTNIMTSQQVKYKGFLDCARHLYGSYGWRVFK